MLVAILSLVALGTAQMDSSLQRPYIAARLSWGLNFCPYVREVRWCADDCVKLQRPHDFYPGIKNEGPVAALNDGMGLILIDPDYMPEAVTATLAHELGHSLGLPDADHGIMSYDWSFPYLMPTAADISRVKKGFLCQE